MSRSRSILLLPLLLLPLLASPAFAVEEDEDVSEWFGPRAGDFELGVGGTIGHMIRSEVSRLDVQGRFGYFITDWISLGLSASLGHVSSSAPANTTSPLIGSTRQALSAGPSVAGGVSTWYGSAALWTKVFPFEMLDDRLVPFYLSPFASVELGTVFAKDLSPFLTLSAAVGLHIYLTNQIALVPEFGYTLIYASDEAISYTADLSGIEHSIGGAWSFAFFF